MTGAPHGREEFRPAHHESLSVRSNFFIFNNNNNTDAMCMAAVPLFKADKCGEKTLICHRFRPLLAEVIVKTLAE